MNPRWRQHCANAILLIVSMGIAMLIGEVCLRWYGYAGAPWSILANVRRVDDPILSWRFVPHSKVRDGNITYEYNGQGFRDVEHAVTKAAGITRLIVLGDSVTEGVGVKTEERFSVRLQRKLGSGREIINLGMSGLNTPQEAHLLEVEGVWYGPDEVIVNFVLNDCDFYSDIGGAEKYEEATNSKIGVLGDVSIDPRVKRILKSSALIYFVKARAEDLLGRFRKEERNYYLRLWASSICRDRLTAGFDHLAQLQRRYLFKVHVVIWPLLVDFRTYDYCGAHEVVYREAIQRGFQVHDILEAFRSVSHRKLQVTAEDVVHPNGFGHQLAAESYFAWRQRNDIPNMQFSGSCHMDR